jgi:hypothetical protein
MPDFKVSLQGKALKCTVVLDAAALVGLEVPNGLAKAPVSVTAGGHSLTADLNAKSLRRAVTAIATAGGPENVTVIIQGNLQGDVLLEAGIVAQPKAPKVAAAA